MKDIKGIALLWQSVFKGVSVISNRKTPKHRDRREDPGDRVCYSHFMRENVRDRLGITPAGWSSTKNYPPC